MLMKLTPEVVMNVHGYDNFYKPKYGYAKSYSLDNLK